MWQQQQSSMSDDVSNRINKIGSRTDLIKQPFKIYENLRSAVSVYRGHGSSSRSGVYQVSGRFLLTHSGCASSSIKYQKSRWTSRETINFNSHGQFVCSYTCYFHKKPRYQFDRNDDVLFINQFHWWLENAGNGTVSPISNSNFLGHWIRRSPYSFFFRLSQDFD